MLQRLSCLRNISSSPFFSLQKPQVLLAEILPQCLDHILYIPDSNHEVNEEMCIKTIYQKLFGHFLCVPVAVKGIAESCSLQTARELDAEWFFQQISAPVNLCFIELKKLGYINRPSFALCVNALENILKHGFYGDGEVVDRDHKTKFSNKVGFPRLFICSPKA